MLILAHMLTSALKVLFGGKQKINNSPEEGVYPPRAPAFQAVDLETLLKANARLIQQIRENFAGTEDEWRTLYLPLIEAYAGYVHLLPASRKHHHRHKGGLLSHGLDVAFHSLRIFETRLFALHVPPQNRKRTQASWRLAIFAAGLCHDIGKPASDMIIKSVPGDLVWDAYDSSMVEWVTKNHIDGFSVDWRLDGRHKRHEAVSQVMMLTRMPQNVRAYISGSPVEDVMGHLMVSLDSGNSNKIHSIVIEADKRSVEDDLKHNSDIAQDGAPETFAALIQSTMRWMVASRKWEPNKPGGPLWCINEHVFLVWPEASKSLIQQLREERVIGIPSNPDVFVDMMLSSSIAVPFNHDDNESEKLWLFKPACLKGKELVALCLESYRIISATELPSVEGVICGMEEQSEGNAPQAGTVQKQEAPLQKDEAKAPEIASDVQGEPNAKPSTRPGNQSVANRPAQKREPRHEQVNQTNKKTEKSAQDVASDMQKEEVVKRTVDRLGQMRDVLLAVADDIRRGVVVMGEHAVIHKGCHLAIKYPDGFNGYGVEPKVIMNRLSKNKVLVQDPIAPQKKVLEIPGFGISGMGKALVLEKKLSMELLEYAGIAPESPDVKDDRKKMAQRKEQKTPIEKKVPGKQPPEKKTKPIETRKETVRPTSTPKKTTTKRGSEGERNTLRKSFEVVMKKIPGDAIMEKDGKTWVRTKDIGTLTGVEGLIITRSMIVRRKKIDGNLYVEVFS